MALFTPSNLKFVLTISILSRVLVLLIQFVSCILIDDHNADAYKNRYYIALSKPANNSSIVSELAPNYLRSYKIIQGLTKWDAQYFLEISKDGYVQERHLAFFPLFPVVISLIRQLIFDHRPLNLDHLIPSSSRYVLQGADYEVTVRELEIYIQSSLIGVILNNFILFPLASIFLFMLTKLVKSNEEKYARAVVLWFCFNPASIFFSACYSESAFAALTFISLFIIEYRASSYLAQHQTQKPDEEFKSLSQLNRLIYIVLPSLVPLTLATGTRSNGLVNIGFIGYQLLIKYLTVSSTNRHLWSFLVYLCVCLELVQDVLVLIMSAVFAASGYITFQIYSYIKFCHRQDQTGAGTKGHMIRRPDWCDKQFPHPYGQVQAKFWNVGLFKYYEMRQLPNFLLAAPVSFIILRGSLLGAKLMARSPRSKQQLVYFLQAIILTILCSISINIQVVTRLVASSCPALYWICVDVSRDSRWKQRLLLTYFGIYFVVGILLHVNFYPWT